MIAPELDARGWIGMGVYALVLLVLLLMAFVPGLRADEFFKTIATLIVGAFIKDVVGWAYQATKGGVELAERNAAIVEGHAAMPPVQQVEVTNTDSNPVKTEEAR